MSRIKSSSVLTGSLVKETFKKYVPYPPRKDITEVETEDMACAMNLVVPNITRNAKQPDGYRKPSSYGMSVLTYFPHLRSNPHSGSFLLPADVSPSKAVFKHAYFTETRTLSGSTVVRVIPTQRSSTWALEQELRMKLLNNVKDEAFNAAMVLSEIGKTANTAANLLYRIGRSMDALRLRKRESFNWLMHGKMGADNRRPTDKFLRETAGLFLEWKYGIMPSIYDLEGITKSLDVAKDGSLFSRPPLMVARANVKRRETVSCLLDFEQGLRDVSGHTCDVETSITGRADFTVSGEGMRTLSEYGIGLTTVATIAYDRTPFSFVANMVVPMAELISAWGALAGVTVRGYTETTYDKYVFSQNSVNTHSSWLGGTAKINIGAGSSSIFTRSGSSSIPMPMPFIRNPVRVGNAATVLALFTQLRRRPKREPKLFGFDNKDL